MPGLIRTGLAASLVLLTSAAPACGLSGSPEDRGEANPMGRPILSANKITTNDCEFFQADYLDNLMAGIDEDETTTSSTTTTTTPAQSLAADLVDTVNRAREAAVDGRLEDATASYNSVIRRVAELGPSAFNDGYYSFETDEANDFLKDPRAAQLLLKAACAAIVDEIPTALDLLNKAGKADNQPVIRDKAEFWIANAAANYMEHEDNPKPYKAYSAIAAIDSHGSTTLTSARDDVEFWVASDAATKAADADGSVKLNVAAMDELETIDDAGTTTRESSRDDVEIWVDSNAFNAALNDGDFDAALAIADLIDETGGYTRTKTRDQVEDQILEAAVDLAIEGHPAKANKLIGKIDDAGETTHDSAQAQVDLYS